MSLATVQRVLRICSIGLLSAGAACAPSGSAVPADPEADTVALGQTDQADAVAQDGWRPLFDGSTMQGWRAFRGTAVPDGWQAVDGALTRVGGGGDIVTTDQFANFELELEWMVRAGGNSGIMYRVTEATEQTYFTGPEMQVLDDAGHPDGQSRLTAAGSAYGLYPASEGAVTPAGEWNQVRLVVDGGQVEHWLNGVKVVEYELGGAEWEQRVRDSKFGEWPGYGRAARGHIALQDHGDWVAYRNIRVRALP